MKLTDNRYVGAVNLLPKQVRNDILQALPLGFLDEQCDPSLVNEVATEVQRMSMEIDSSTSIEGSLWMEATKRLQQHGREILDTHRDMYLSAIEEGRIREAEAAMKAHVEEVPGGRKVLSPEQVQRLSVFRVKRHFDQIETYLLSLREWSFASKSTTTGATPTLPENWEYTLPVNVGDRVDADLGGALFPAVVLKVVGDSYDVQFFDGDKEFGMSRDMLKLMVPPKPEEEVDTSSMTPKQLKRWKKEQERNGRN
jgi:hypothetical protein